MAKPSPSLFFNLPQDIIFNILSRLPTKTLIQFTAVSTSSPPLISHPSFINLHLSSTAAAADHHHFLIYNESTDYIHEFYPLRSPITFQETLNLQINYKNLHGYLRIVGSSKGLICFFDTNYNSNIGRLILYNPSIQKYRKIDDFASGSVTFSRFLIGFGFVSRVFEFKIVVIGYHLGNNNNNKNKNSVMVYSLSSNSWKKLEDLIIAPCYFIDDWCTNVVVNGFVNWLGCCKDEDKIMTFDLDQERFRVLEFPKNIVPNYDRVCLVSHIKGECLLLCALYFGLNGDKWDLWAMNDYGVVESWKKVCVFSYPGLSIMPLLFRDDDEILVAMNDEWLMILDVVKGEMRDLEMCGLGRSFRAVSYTPSLALLHG